MRCDVRLDHPLLRTTETQGPLLRALCETVVQANLALSARLGQKIPNLYSCGVRYAEEVGEETLVTYDVTLQRGKGDCGHLACWRVAWLRQNGFPDATVRISGKRRGVKRYFHAIVEVRRNSFEDPSSILGM